MNTKETLQRQRSRESLERWYAERGGRDMGIPRRIPPQPVFKCDGCKRTTDAKLVDGRRRCALCWPATVRA